MARTTHELTCINCPLGCALTVTVEEGAVISVTGNTCKRGEAYGRHEVLSPTRTITTSVPVIGSVDARMVSVKTAGEVPKDLIFPVMDVLRGVRVTAPVHIGDVVVADILGTGVSVVATREAH